MENDDFVELLKRRVEEEVKANVEEKLLNITGTWVRPLWSCWVRLVFRLVGPR